MEKYSVSEVIEEAVQTEKLGNVYYETMAARFAENTGLRKLFDTLAAKELVHQQTFADLKEIVKEEESVDWEQVTQYLRAFVESEFFLGKSKSLPALEHVNTVEDAVKFAMAFEKETLLYYHKLRELVKEKEVVDEIINEEQSHIMWLAKFKDSFK